MEKILLIGKFSQLYKELSNALSEKYEVKACINILEIFDEMYKRHTPNLIVVIIDEKGKHDKDLLDALENQYINTSVICVCPEADDEWIKKQMKRYRFVYMPAVYTMEDVYKMVEHLLKGRKLEEEFDSPGGVEQREERKETKEVKIQSLKSGKKDILLVDDSGIALRTLKVLIGDKYDVRMVTSGIDAITMILKKTPDLILLDYEMPLLDGKQTMEKIKNLEEAKDIPIVFVTAVNDKEHIRSVLELKPAGYLLKPVDKDRLLETIGAIIGE